jgi:hypothetical protein
LLSHWITPQIIWAEAGPLPTKATSTTAAAAAMVTNIAIFFLVRIFLLLFS